MTSLRQWMDIVSGKALAEASLGYQYGYRSWYNLDRQEWINIGPTSSHSRAVLSDPAAFGVAEADLAGIEDRKQDRVHDALFAACANGWVRIAASDRNNPYFNMVFEASKLSSCLEVLLMFYEASKGKMENCTLKVISKTGSREFPLLGPQQVERAAMDNKLPKSNTLDRDDSLAA